jgi:hypothetical protein
MFQHQAEDPLVSTKTQSITAKGYFQLSTKLLPSRTENTFHRMQRAR